MSKRGAAVRDITLKKTKQDETFHIHRIEEPEDLLRVEPLQEQVSLEPESGYEEPENEALASVALPREPEVFAEPEPRDFVRVKFSKFVQLVSTHDCTETVNNNQNEDIIMSSNLLTELASTHDEREEKKIPLVFLVGLAIGVVLTYILFTK